MADDGAPLVVMALPAEGAGRFEARGVAVLYTGVGKVNAAIALSRELARRPDGGRGALVLNFGTAGSERLAPGTLVGCRRFVDRDMDVSALGVAPGTTPFDPLPAMLEFERRFPSLPDAVCGSGDSFATAPHGPRCDVVDMEAYALAKASLLAGAGFACAKFVSDGADAEAARHWRENVARAADDFVGLYEQLLSRRPGASRA